MTDPDLVRAARALTLAARALERAVADKDLTLAQYRVLALVAGGDERSSLLADRLAVAKPTITAVVDGLVERGLIERGTVDGDRRSIRLGLTKAGTKALRDAEHGMAASLERIFGHAEHRNELIAALADLDGALTARMLERRDERARA